MTWLKKNVELLKPNVLMECELSFLKFSFVYCWYNSIDVFLVILSFFWNNQRKETELALFCKTKSIAPS
jgi:hypothetical protein